LYKYKLWFENETREECMEGCKKIYEALGNSHAANEAALGTIKKD